VSSAFDPQAVQPETDPLAGDILGAHWAVSMGIDHHPSIHDDEPCVVCGAPFAACTSRSSHADSTT
jgi:hypothetical protein